MTTGNYNGKSSSSSCIILTRATRKEVGAPPPTPFFKGPSKLTQNPRHDIQPSPPMLASDCGEPLCETEPQTSCEESEGGEVWVMCDSEECEKWRSLPPGTVIDTHKEWYCSMHPDPAYQSCDTPEEKWNTRKHSYTYTQLERGALIWARLSGHSEWPAIISPDPWSGGEHVAQEREGVMYHVEFLGRRRSHVWIPEDKIEPYKPRSSTKPRSRKRRGSKSRPLPQTRQQSLTLQFALTEADSFINLTNQERLEKCTFTEATVKTEVTSAVITPKQAKIEPQTSTKVVFQSSQASRQNKQDISSRESVKPQRKRGRKPQPKVVKALSPTQLINTLSQLKEGTPQTRNTLLQSLQSQISCIFTLANPLNIVGQASSIVQSKSLVQKVPRVTASIVQSKSLIQAPGVTSSESSSAQSKPTSQTAKKTKLINPSSTNTIKQLLSTSTHSNTELPSPPLVQSSLPFTNKDSTSTTHAKKPITRRKRKSVTVSIVSGKGNGTVKSVSPSIKDYFKSPQRSATTDQTVPSSPLATEATRAEAELELIEDMISSFGPPSGHCVEGDYGAMDETPVSGCTQEVGVSVGGASDPELQTAMDELKHIEDFISELS